MKEKRISVNLILNVFKTILNLCFPLITFPYVSRVVQAENYGKVNFGSSVVSYFLLIAALGISTYAIREGSKIKNDKRKFEEFVSEIFTINIISTVFSYILLGFTYIFWRKLQSYSYLLLIQSLVIFFTTIGVEWIYSIYEDYLYITLRSIFMQILSLVLLFLFVKSPDDYIIYAAISVVSNVGSNVFNFFHARKYCKIRLNTKPRFIKHIIPMIILFFSNVTIAIYVNSDITILNIFKDDYAVGLYSVSVKIYTILKQLVSAVFFVILPRLSFYVANDKLKYKQLLHNLKKGILFFTIPIVVGTYSLSSQIILVLSGNEYLMAESSLKILAIALIFSAYATMYGNGVLLLKNMEKKVLISTIIGALANVILNIIFIPKYSYNAAAFTTLFSEFLVLVVDYIFARDILREIDRKINLNLAVRILIGSILIFVICSVCKRVFSNSMVIILASVIVSGTIYVGILLAKNKQLIDDFIEIKKASEKKNDYSS